MNLSRLSIALAMVLWPLSAADAQPAAGSTSGAVSAPAPSSSSAAKPSPPPVKLALVVAKSANPVKPKLRFSGDFRYRFEHDWDSRNDNGSYRKDRFRMRYRARAGFTYAMDRNFKFGARLRTGVPTNMQSPHLNVGYTDFSSGAFSLDKAYIAARHKQLWGWVGKNSFPLWKQNELFWDDDVTPEGIAVGAKFDHGDVQIRPTAAYFVANHEQVLERRDAHLAMAQVAATVKLTSKVTLDVASAYVHGHRLFDKPAHLGGTNRQDYQFIVSGVRATLKLGQPLVIGLDHMVNIADYANVDHIPDHYKDQKTGFVAHVHVGSKRKAGDWQLGYYFAYKEKYSVVDYFGEDDWVRWGNVDRNRNTNYSGHEVRIVYVLKEKLNLVLRGYMVEALQARVENDPAAVTETGNRVRFEINFGF